MSGKLKTELSEEEFREGQRMTEASSGRVIIYSMPVTKVVWGTTEIPSPFESKWL